MSTPQPELDEPTHEALRDTLPLYALDALDPSDVAVIERHLAVCDSCHEEVAALRETAALLAFAAPPAHPAPAVKVALLQRVAVAQAAPDEPVVASLPTRRARRATGARGGWWQPALTFATLAAAILLLVWNLVLRQQLRETEQRAAAEAARLAEASAIAQLLRSPTAAHSLTDSELTPRPVGYIYTDPESSIALMLAYRMPPLPPGTRYQLWLITPDGTRQSGGLFTVDPQGSGQVLIHAPAPFRAYRAVGVTIEPWDGSPSPTTTRIVGGAVQ